MVIHMMLDGLSGGTLRNVDGDKKAMLKSCINIAAQTESENG